MALKYFLNFSFILNAILANYAKAEYINPAERLHAALPNQVTIDLTQLSTLPSIDSKNSITPLDHGKFDVKDGVDFTFLNHKAGTDIDVYILPENTSDENPIASFDKTRLIDNSPPEKVKKISIIEKDGKYSILLDGQFQSSFEKQKFQVEINYGNAVIKNVLTSPLGEKPTVATIQVSEDGAAPTGIPIHDAILLYNFKQAGNNKGIRRVLDYWNYQIGDNTYLDEVAKTSSASGTFGDILSKNISPQLAGLTDLILQNAQKEVGLYAYERLQKIIDTYPELAILFSESHSTLEDLKEKDFTPYSEFERAINQSVNVDLINLCSNFIKLSDLDANTVCVGDNCKKRIEFYTSLKSKREGVLLHLLLFGADKAINGGDPAVLINSYNAFVSETISKYPYFANNKDSEKENLINGTKTVALFSESIRGVNENETYASFNDLKKLKNDEIFKYFLGFVIEMNKNEKYRIKYRRTGGAEVVLQVILGNKEKIEAWKKYIGDVVESANELNGSIKDLKERSKAKQSFTYVEFTKYYSSFLKMLESIASYSRLGNIDAAIASLESPLNSGGSKNVRIFLNQADYVGKIYFNVSSKNYSSAALYLNKLVDENFKSVSADSKIIDVIKDAIQISAGLGNFATAESAEQAKLALESITLPAGSSRVKRINRFNLSINSYVGAQFAYEELRIRTDPNFNVYQYSNKANFGLSVPVGFAISKGRLGRGSSLSIFTPIIDVGAIARVRIDDRTQSLPEISFRNIFTPGIYLVYGFRNSPFSLGLGAQRTAPLRKIVTGSNGSYSKELIDVDSKKSFQFGLIGVIDVPLFNLAGTRYLRVKKKDRK